MGDERSDEIDLAFLDAEERRPFPPCLGIIMRRLAFPFPRGPMKRREARNGSVPVGLGTMIEQIHRELRVPANRGHKESGAAILRRVVHLRPSLEQQRDESL